MRTDTLEYLAQLRRRLDNERETFDSLLLPPHHLTVYGASSVRLSYHLNLEHLTRQALRRDSLAYPNR
jgi:hypothetical protein